MRYMSQPFVSKPSHRLYRFILCYFYFLSFLIDLHFYVLGTYKPNPLYINKHDYDLKDGS